MAYTTSSIVPRSCDRVWNRITGDIVEGWDCFCVLRVLPFYFLKKRDVRSPLFGFPFLIFSSGQVRMRVVRFSSSIDLCDLMLLVQLDGCISCL